MKFCKIVLLNVLLIMFSCSNISINEKKDLSNLNKDIYSPDKSLKLTLNCTDGFITYSLTKNKKLIIDKSILGLQSDKFDFSDDLVILDYEINKNNDDECNVLGDFDNAGNECLCLRNRLHRHILLRESCIKN